MKGAGTNDALLVRIVVSRSEVGVCTGFRMALNGALIDRRCRKKGY